MVSRKECLVLERKADGRDISGSLGFGRCSCGCVGTAARLRLERRVTALSNRKLGFSGFPSFQYSVKVDKLAVKLMIRADLGKVNMQWIAMY